MSFDRAKAVVRQFNEQVIVEGDRAAFEALIAPDFVNRSVPPGAPNGPESMVEYVPARAALGAGRPVRDDSRSSWRGR